MQRVGHGTPSKGLGWLNRVIPVNECWSIELVTTGPLFHPTTDELETRPTWEPLLGFGDWVPKEVDRLD